MKIFISWSGEASRKAAELIKQWLPGVIQEADVWVSSQDIGKGENWNGTLWQNLHEIEFGILMITKDNYSAPWIMFEAGAISKTVKSKVIPILCDVDRLDIAKTPLAQFQNALVNKEDMLQVIVAINNSCVRQLPEARLTATFEKWWPDFEKEFSEIEFHQSSAVKPTKSQSDSIRLDKIENALESIMRTLQVMQNKPVKRFAPIPAPAARQSNSGITVVLQPDGKLLKRQADGTLVPFIRNGEEEERDEEDVFK